MTKRRPGKYDLAVILLAFLAVLACLAYPVPGWMLVLAAVVLLVAIVSLAGNLGAFGRRRSG